MTRITSSYIITIYQLMEIMCFTFEN